MTDIIVNYWPQWFRDRFGGKWPDEYVTFDTESTGFDVTKDVPWEIAHCLVQNRKVVDRLSVIIDWTNHSIVPDHWLRSRLKWLKQSMELNGAKCHITYEQMQEQGLKPEKALPFYYDLFRTFQQKNMVFVGRGSYAFDERLLAHSFAGFGIADDFRFDDNSMLDMDGVEKASQLLDTKKAHVQEGDTLRSYFHRVKYIRANGIKSNLDTHCYHKYELQKRGIAHKELHKGVVDSYCEHLMMEIYRPLIGPSILVPPVALQTQPTLLPLRTTQPRQQPVRQAATPTVRRRGQRNN